MRTIRTSYSTPLACTEGAYENQRTATWSDTAQLVTPPPTGTDNPYRLYFSCRRLIQSRKRLATTITQIPATAHTRCRRPA